MRKKKVLIFGGSGFIGTHFNAYVSNLPEFEVSLFDIEKRQGVTYLDVRNEIEIDGDFSYKDIIINLAAVHRTPGHPDYEYFETNIRGAENICEFATRAGINNMIFTSSIAPYGASEDLKTEETLPAANTPYGISKLVAEYIHREWAAKNTDRKLMILRPGVVFGKGENGNFTRLAAALKKGLFLYPGRKDTIKGCIYVKELVYQCWDLFKYQSNHVEIYNFTYKPSYTIEEIVQVICVITNCKRPTVVIPAGALMLAARVFRAIGLGRYGFHPDRVKKLMTSTNISGKKLRKSVDGDYQYSLEEALQDWHEDCNNKGLY